MAVNLSPVGGVAAQFFDNSGNVLTGGKIYTYLAGTTTPAATYTTSAGNVLWSNPIVLDASGRVSGSGEIWLTDSVQYKFVVKDSNEVLIGTYDNIVGINSNFVNFVSDEETQTATQGQTVFNLTTMEYQPGVNNLLVFVNGSKQIITTNYIETDSDTVTFVDGLNVGDVVDFITATPINTITADAASTSYDPPFAGGVATNVEAKLGQNVATSDVLNLTDALTAADGAEVQVNTDIGTSWFTKNGVTYQINETAPVNLSIRESGHDVSQGVYRKYEYDVSAPDAIENQSGEAHIYDVNVTNLTVPTSGSGLNVLTEVHTDAAVNFAWHNIQSYVTSDAEQPAEITAMYYLAETTNGASAEGGFITAVASGNNAYNLGYGLQIKTVDNVSTAPYGSGFKMLSMVHEGVRALPIGAILFGSAGITKAYIADNKGDRDESEIMASGNYGGDIDYAFVADSTAYTTGLFTDGTTDLVIGDTLTGASSSSSAVLKGYKITSGSLSAGDAAGTLYLSGATAAFTPGENLLNGASVAAVNGAGNLLTAAGNVYNGYTANNIAYWAFQVTDDTAYATPLWGVNGAGAVRRKIQSVPASGTSFSAAIGDVYQTSSSATGNSIANITGGLEGQEITIIGATTGATPTVIKNNTGSGSSNINLNGSDWTAGSRKVLKLVYNGQWNEISRT